MLKPVFGGLLSGLLLSVAGFAATEAPAVAEQQRILDQVRQYAGRYLETLPNFVCARVTEQYEAGKKPTHWRQHDTLTARLVFNEGKENQTLEMVNGKPISPGKFVEQPLATDVEFGGLVSNVLDSNSDATISWKSWEDLRGRRLAVFDYVINQEHSRISVGVNGMEIVVPYHGLIYADAENGELWRITSAPFNIPDFVDTKSVSTTVDYGPVDINARRFILPITASVLLDTGKRNIWNKVFFNEYRKFEAESKIIFVAGSN